MAIAPICSYYTLFSECSADKPKGWVALFQDDGIERPYVSVEGIENGDWVVVTGELKSEGDYRPLNDFWASKISVTVK